MSLTDLQRSWDELARKDAMWAVLTGPVGADRRWSADEFFGTGREEVAFILDRVAHAGLTPAWGRALDFGCGVGRLTQALAGRFARADGIDISAAMVEQARSLNQFGDRCQYHVNAAADLALFPDATFDFVYSSITLQHIEPQYSRRYVDEFFRVVRPGGVVVFQLPSHPLADERPRTACDGPLPDEAFRASIKAPERLECLAGERLIVPTVVRNTSSVTWPARGRDDDTRSVRLGNHWRSRFGFMRVFNDRRERLPYDVAPGESVELGLEVYVPAKPGVYILELDMVQENVRWFASVGSPPTRIRVRVHPARPVADADPAAPARMQMHGIPRAEVEQIIAARGGRLLTVEENDAAGGGWRSFRYCATR